MDVNELHDEENLLAQMQDRWERSALPLRYAKNYGSLDGIADTHDPFDLAGAPRFELYEKRYQKIFCQICCFVVIY